MESVRQPATVKRDRVRQYLMDVIERSGPGTPLPPERDLALELGVSRPTLRAAIEELTRIGLLVRQHGRGTFTNAQKVSQQLTGTSSNAFAVPPAEGTWTSRVLTFETGPAGAPRAVRLNVSPAEPVTRVRRLRLVDGSPMAIERIDVPAVLVPDLAAEEMESGNFYRLQRSRYEIVVSDAVQTIEPSVTDAGEAELLEVPVFAPVLLFERTTRDVTGRVVEFARSVYRGDRYRITSKLRFDSSSG
ncbi:MAG TPA: GntR family transcriptional regulator [Pseudonocardiaceae bacterium]|nr:GntR family transcriptional regulator [Pseudonocardiaceae bacterium]